MQKLDAQHPGQEKLAAFGLGQLSDEESQAIELHIANCDECREKVDEAPADSLIHLLRTAAAETFDGLAGPLADTAPLTPAQEPLPRVFTVPRPLTPRELDGHARYLLLAPLSSGGMGTVYKARHRLMDRVVALKIVNPILVSKPGAVERFTREVKAAAQLAHPNIVVAYDAEKVGDMHLLVMEFVEGQTLSQVLALEPQLPVARACEYLRQTALGLQHALDRGMVHRDIKPQNLMLTPKGEVKILDFGLARFVSEEAHAEGVTESGTIMGSPDYMAPEQGQDAHLADARADIYSMGCTLYHLLAGQVPFPATSLLAKLAAHRDKQPAPLHQVRADVPKELAKIVTKMMAKDPARRFQRPAEVAEALLPCTRDEEERASGEKILPVPRAPRIISRSLVFAIALGLPSIVGGTGYWAAQIVFRVETPHGILSVKTDDPDVRISVKSGGKEVSLFFPKDKKELPLEIGRYTIELVGGKDGLKLSTNKFEIAGGNDRKTVRVEYVPAVAAAKAPPQAKQLDPDRAAAEYVLSIGGKVRVHGQDREITADVDLPPEPFRLSTIVLTWNQHVSDAGLASFTGCKNLTDLGLGGTNVGDEGLAHFKDCKNLTTLALDGTQVSDTGLGYFKDCENLIHLFLENTKVSDTGLAHFKGRNLRVLVLSRTPVTDAGLANFKDCRELYWLWLADTKVSDEGLAHFKDRNVLFLDLSDTRATDAGLANFKNCKNLRDLGLNNTQVGDEGLAHFQQCKNLKMLLLANMRVSDASLPYIKDCKNMRRLALKKTQVTAAAIAELRQALPQCTIE